MKRLCVYLLVLGLNGSSAFAQATVSFQGKTVTAIISSSAGGGTDAFGRLAAAFLEKYLPASPTVVARNVPGADGMSAMNFMVKQVTPDGYTFVVASNSTADPLNYRRPQSQFNPVDFAVIGGAGRSGEVLLINAEALKRLHDKNAAPVVMGSLGGIPRSGMQMTAWGIEYLGWNATWVVGYRGTNELTLALERGEIDMTSTGHHAFIKKLVETGKFKILTQAGTLKDGVVQPDPDYGDSPLFGKLMEGKIKDPLAAKAFEYWANVALSDKWLALPPKTPKAMVDAYRSAYDKMAKDSDFISRSKTISDDFVAESAADVEAIIHKLGSLPQEAVEYMATILQKQGVKSQ
jgi:tripartite-type tricarboxylate transporter receptor subunit TctC